MAAIVLIAVLAQAPAEAVPSVNADFPRYDYAVWALQRTGLIAKAAELSLPVENLLTPDHVRRLAWQPPSPPGSQAVDSALERLGARPWQRELTVGLITPLLAS